MRRGEIWWAALGDATGSGPGFRRPILVIQDDSFNASRIGTVVAAAITSNVKLAQAPGNVLLKARETGLAKNSVVNVSQIITLDKALLAERVGAVSLARLEEIDSGLRLVLSL